MVLFDRLLTIRTLTHRLEFIGQFLPAGHRESLARLTPSTAASADAASSGAWPA
jgi:hypothetical protein